MKWFEIELEIPIYGKSFEIVQALDSETAIQIAIKKTVDQYNIPVSYTHLTLPTIYSV